MLFGKKEVLKNNHWAGRSWGNMWFVKKHWNQLAEAPIGQTKDNLENQNNDSNGFNHWIK